VRTKSTALKAQEQVVVSELIKYVELIAATRSINVEDFIDYATRRPAFLLVAASIGGSNDLLMSSHVLSPATLRQDHLEAVEMKMAAQYGRSSAATLLMARLFRDKASEIIEIAEEIGQMAGGVGHA
jgi:hypothetical protein